MVHNSKIIRISEAFASNIGCIFRNENKSEFKKERGLKFQLTQIREEIRGILPNRQT